VGAHENKRAVKPGIANARHGDKDLAFKVMRSSHGHNLSGIEALEKQSIVTGN
jgi:hypothetical protein